MIDVKKLVTGFLILAAATSSSAFLVLKFGGGIGAANITANTSAGATNDTAQPAPLSGNAFLPQISAGQLADISNSQQLSSTTAAIGNDPNNLTNILAEEYLNGLVVANPTGPTTDSQGDQTLNPPSTTDIIDQLAASSSAAVSIPNWDLEAAEIPIMTMSDSSETVSSYNAAIQNIISQDIVQSNLESMLSDSSDPTTATYAEGKIKSALEDIGGVKTPASLVPLEKSLITLFVYEKNVLAMGANAESDLDPVKTSIILQAEEPKYNAAVANLETQLQTDPTLDGLAFGGTTDEKQSPVVAFVDGLVGIKTAHAQWITLDPAVLAQMIVTAVFNTMLQIIKNLIVGLIQNKILAWVRGTGTPKFIQSWATTIANSYQQSLVGSLNSQLICTNPAILPQVKLLTQPSTPTNVGGGNVCTTQFPTILTSNNLSNFYNNFSSGGFNSYLALFQPGGNSFGESMDAQDAAITSAADQSQAKQAQSVANQGFTSDETCDDGSDPDNGEHAVCPAGYSLSADDSTLCINDANGYVSQYDMVLEPNDGLCADGSEPSDVSPGIVTGQVFNSAVDSGSNLVTSANDITGVIAAAFSSLLSSLASEALTVTTGAFSSTSGNGTTNVPGGGTVSVSGSGSSTTITGYTQITCDDHQAVGGVNATSVGISANTFFFQAGGGIIINDGSVTNPQFEWSAPSGTPPVGTTASFQTAYNATGTFVVTVTDLITGNIQTCPPVTVNSLSN